MLGAEIIKLPTVSLHRMDDPQFLSPEGYDPKVWGKSLWLSMTIIASNMPLRPSRAQSVSYYRFFDGLRHVLPCKSCRTEYCRMIGEGAPSLRLKMSDFVQTATEPPGSARKRVFAWVVRIHAHVNRRLGKRRRSSVHFWARAYSKLRRSSAEVSTIRFPSGNVR